MFIRVHFAKKKKFFITIINVLWNGNAIKGYIMYGGKISIIHLEIHTYKIIGQEDTWNENVGNAHCICWNK